MITEGDLYFWTCSCGWTDNWLFKPDSEAVKRLDAALAALDEVIKDFPDTRFAKLSLERMREGLFRTTCQSCKKIGEIGEWKRIPLHEDMRWIVRQLGMEKR